MRLIPLIKKFYFGAEQPSISNHYEPLSRARPLSQPCDPININMSFQTPTLPANTVQSNSEMGYIQAFPDSFGTAREHVSSTSPCYVGFSFGNDDIENSHIHHTRDILHVAPISLSGSGSPQQHAAYWYCCQEDHMNSYALAPERCSLCPHFRCANCADA